MNHNSCAWRGNGGTCALYWVECERLDDEYIGGVCGNMRISVKYDAVSVKKKIRVPEDWDSLVATIKRKFNIDQSANVLLFDAHGSYCTHKRAV